MTLRRVSAWVLLFCASTSVSAARWQGAPFTGTTDGVRLDVSVFDGPNAVRGLSARDFEVFDNKGAQQFYVTETHEAPLDLVLVVQSPGSLTMDRQRLIQEAARSVTALTHDGDRVGLVIASAPPSVRRRLVPGTDGITQVSIDGDGSVALRDAILDSLALFDHERRRKVIVVFTDGQHDQSWVSEKLIQTATDREVVQVIVAAIDSATSRASYTAWNDGRQVGERWALFGGTFEVDLPHWLVEMMRRTGGRCANIRGVRVSEQVLEVMSHLRSQYVITYMPTNAGVPGWHDIKVNVKRKGDVVLTRTGYWIGASGQAK